MRSGWFWNTPQWAEYQQAYWAGRQRPDEYKSSPLADDHELFDADGYERTVHETQVLDLSSPLETLWAGVRKSYHSIIHRANERFKIIECNSIMAYLWVHAEANGGKPPRSEATYECQDRWLGEKLGLLVEAWRDGFIVAAAYWIVYQGGAYYASGPSIEKNVQHAVIWKSIELLKARGVRLIELGDIGWMTTKEEGISRFKRGFGGQSVPFTIARRRA